MTIFLYQRRGFAPWLMYKYALFIYLTTLLQYRQGCAEQYSNSVIIILIFILTLIAISITNIPVISTIYLISFSALFWSSVRCFPVSSWVSNLPRRILFECRSVPPKTLYQGGYFISLQFVLGVFLAGPNFMFIKFHINTLFLLHCGYNIPSF